jgi:RNA polymerase sigma-70 factor (ECF subfamily)
MTLMVETPSLFPLTRWTQVEGAAQPDAPEQTKVLGELLTLYLPALRAYLRAQFRMDAPGADDLLQGFVADKVIQGGVLARADRRRGRFRTFLLSALTNYTISELRRGQAKKRAPMGASSSLDDLIEQGAEFPALETAHPFDVAFAQQVIAEAMRRMEQQCRAGNREDIWGVFVARLLNPIFGSAPAADYQALIERFGFQSPGHAANVLITAKRMFARVLRGVVGEYVGDPAEVEPEVRELRAVLSEKGGAGEFEGVRKSPE